MTTPNDSAKPTGQAPKPQPPRTRSPAYPSFGLSTAYDRAKALYPHIKRNTVPPSTLAAVWESNLKSSATQLAISTLKKYGLLDEVDSENGRLFKLSPSALILILGDQSDTPERTAIIKQFALKPKIFAQLWKQFDGDLPSDVALRSHLLLEKNFNDAAVDGFIKSFKDTIAFANLSQSDKITSIDGEEDEEDSGGSGENPQTETPVAPTVKDAQMQDVKTNLKIKVMSAGTVGTTAVLREFSFPLPSGVAYLKVPFPLTEEDFDSLTRTMRNFKDGLVKTEVPTVDCNSVDWEARATDLAKAGIEFNLTGFEYSFNIEAATKIATDNLFRIRLDLNKGIAIFKKKEV